MNTYMLNWRRQFIINKARAQALLDPEEPTDDELKDIEHDNGETRDSDQE